MPHRYDIPRVRLRNSKHRLAIIWATCAVVFTWAGYRALQISRALHGHDSAALLWTALFLSAGHQITLAWLDKPFTVSPRQQELLDRLFVCVNVPVYNEDPATLDRTLYALFHQTRLPNRVQVVDDGSTTSDYAAIRDHWLAAAPARVDFSWVRTPNRGKRHAQAVTFHRDRSDILVTVDSDTTLELRAIEEGLKPFVNRKVQSVAGIEVAYNAHANLLTRIGSLRQLAWQLTQCCVLSMAGDVLVNRGTFALYRGPVIRDNLGAYLSETFLGRQVRFSDDSLLTLFALQRGRAVQQLTAFQLPMYPEKVSHALRQWLRWMRGSTIRNFWRLRYLPMWSYGWWMSLLSWWQFAISSIAYIWVFVWRPLEGHFSITPIMIVLLSSYLVTMRSLLIARSDHSSISQLDTYLLAPFNLVWSLLVLRPLRLWGVLTCARTQWGTRQQVEVGISAREAALPAPAMTGGMPRRREPAEPPYGPGPGLRTPSRGGPRAGSR
jgi:hyaluronan synthase